MKCITLDHRNSASLEANKNSSVFKLVLVVSALAVTGWSSSSVAFVEFTGGPVIDITTIKSNIISDVKEHAEYVSSIATQAQNMLSKTQNVKDEIIDNNKNTATDIIAKTDVMVGRFNAGVIADMMTSGVNICVDKGISVDLAEAMCEKAVVMGEALDNINEHEKISSWQTRLESRKTVAEQIDSQLSSGTLPIIAPLPSMLYSKPSESVYRSTLQAIRIGSGSGEFRQDNATDFEISGTSSGLAAYQIQHGHQSIQSRFSRHLAYYLMASPVEKMGYQGKISELDGLYAISAAEFGGEFSKTRAMINDSIENRATPVVWKNKLISASKRLYLKLRKYEELLALESGLGLILKSSNTL